MSKIAWYFLGVIIGVLIGESMFNVNIPKDKITHLSIPVYNSPNKHLAVEYMDTYWGLVDGCELTIAGKDGIISVDDMCQKLLEEMKD